MSIEKPLRVGMITLWDAQDPTVLSGMPYHMMKAFEGTGIEIIHLSPEKPEQRATQHHSPIKRLSKLLLDSPLGRKLRARVQLRRKRLKLLKEHTRTHLEVIADARAASERINKQIVGENLDALYGVCMSTAIPGIETDLPIVYTSDATAQLMFDTYPDSAAHGEGYRRACMELENMAMARVDVAVFPSKRSLESAIEDHGLPRAKARLLPFGANITARLDQQLELDPPSRERLELVLVAADPLRKRLDFCVEITELLRSRGVHASLNSIGTSTARAGASPFVNCLGRLSMSEPSDRELHQDVLQRSHLMLLPSLGEMFGIAPGEAAHFGRPSLVSDVGGLPTVVDHGRSGLGLPEDATAEDYADAIIALVDDSTRYRALSEGALERAKQMLNWEAFAREMGLMMREVCR